MFFDLVALLTCVSVVCLAGFALFLIGCRSARTRPPLRRAFLLLSLCLLLWLMTLFWEVRTSSPALQLGLGRMNFAVIVFAVYFALRFVQEVPPREPGHRAPCTRWLLLETFLMAAITQFTPFIAAAERVIAGQAITTFGFLFPLYLLHVLGFLGAALLVAFRERRRADNAQVRRQLTLITGGMLITGSIAIITNALLPYGFGDFRFCDLGTLSTLGFTLAIAYATFLHGLFGLRVLLLATLVYGLLMAFVLGAYSSAVFVLTQVLTDSAGKWVQFAVLLIAFSFDPLRRFLEEKTDRLLFGERGREPEGETRRGCKQSSVRWRLALLFPWRH